MITVKLFGTLRIDSGVKEVQAEAAGSAEDLRCITTASQVLLVEQAARDM